MLQILRIKNIAIIDSAEIHFKGGLNILSGETGTGKSIIIEAISLLLGSRASTELIRAGKEDAIVEGFFDISEIPWISERLKEAGFENSNSELLVKRIVSQSGKHRIYINGELATLTLLQKICDGLIDLCGQHEHQSLLKPPRQLELLDEYGALREEVKKVSLTWTAYRGLIQKQKYLENSEIERIKKTDFLKFQIEEIQQAQLKVDEEQELQKEKQLLQSAETRAKLGETIRQILESEENSGVLNQLRFSIQKIKSLAHLDSKILPLSESLERALAETEEVALSLNKYLSSIEMDSELLQNIQDRLSLIGDLRRKYGAQVSDVLETLNALDGELSSLNQSSAQLLEIKSQISKVEALLQTEGQHLSLARKKAATLLAQSVTRELKDLKMADSKFLIELQYEEHPLQWTSLGGDSIQFAVQTNRGEPSRPLGKIASGGELSRLMLAIRRVISQKGGIGVYLFDEIDAGIGGQTAFEVGKKLRSVASRNQVICITHLPQVASFAHHHLVVKKMNHGDRTTTEIIELNSKSQCEEIARMLGGPRLTPKSLENASELLELAHSKGRGKRTACSAKGITLTRQ